MTISISLPHRPHQLTRKTLDWWMSSGGVQTCTSGFCSRVAEKDSSEVVWIGSSSTALIYECTDVLLLSLTQIIHNSLTTGVVPSDFKTSIVKLLLKKQSLDPNNLKNHRPWTNSWRKPFFINSKTIWSQTIFTAHSSLHTTQDIAVKLLLPVSPVNY